jgi:hypothetical protein
VDCVAPPVPPADIVLRCQRMAETANISVRMNRETAARIRARAEARGERLSDALRRYAEEGDRAETHPGIVFRPGPAGRRAALAGGPDVWEICWAARELGGGKQVAERLAEDLSLTPDRVAVALRYAAEFPEEIEARIELHERETSHYESLAGN